MPRAPAPATALSPMLQRLAAERATGALIRDRGTL
ncbi:transcriptional regulator, partial [Streptomyces sp. NPDC001274]